jgi:hypothetical protein
MKALSGTETLNNLKIDRDVLRATTAFVDGVTAVNSELVSYAQNSWRNSLAIAEEMRQCSNPREVLDLQLRHAARSYEDYLDGARKVGELMTRLSTEAVNALTPPAAR